MSWQPPYWAPAPDTSGDAGRPRDVSTLRALAEGLPVVIHDEILYNGGRTYRVRVKLEPTRVLMIGRYHVIAAYLQGWIDATRESHASATGATPDGPPPAPPRPGDLPPG